MDDGDAARTAVDGAVEPREHSRRSSSMSSSEQVRCWWTSRILDSLARVRQLASQPS